MPVEVREIRRVLPDDVAASLERVYVDCPGMASAEDALGRVRAGLARGDRFYAGLFNGKWIAGVLVVGEGAERFLRYLAVHPATRGRGVAERLIGEVRRLESELGEGYLVSGFDLSQEGLPEMLLAMGFIPHGDDGYRCQL